jgi:hypothetical protein
LRRRIARKAKAIECGCGPNTQHPSTSSSTRQKRRIDRTNPGRRAALVVRKSDEPNPIGEAVMGDLPAFAQASDDDHLVDPLREPINEQRERPTGVDAARGIREFVIGGDGEAQANRGP